MAEKRKVLLITSCSSDVAGGSFMRELSECLTTHDTEVHFCVVDSKVELDPTNPFPVHFVANRFSNGLITSLQIARLANQLNIDLLHSWTNEANRIATLASVACGKSLLVSKFDLLPAKPMECSVADWKKYIPGLPNLFSLGGSESFAQRIVVSHPIIQNQLMAEGIRENSIDLLPNHVGRTSSRKNSGPQSRHNELKQKLGLPDETFLIVACAGFLPRNRLKDLLWAVDLVQCVRDDFRFLLFGCGPQEWRLKRFAQQCTADQKTVFMGGTDSLERCLSEADMFWHSYVHDPSPYFLKLALKSGCPVIAPRGPGMDEIVEDGVNGHLVELGKRDQYARLTNALFKYADKLSQFKTAAKQFDAENCMDDTANALVNIYQSFD